jgi:carbonic anhydrase-like protein
MQATFGTAINCIDGRVQPPVTAWLRERFGLDFIDTITEPGADAFVARRPDEALAVLWPKLMISIERHASPVLAITAHHDCAANPVAEDEHRALLVEATRILRGWSLGRVKIMALWVNAHWQVEVVVSRGAEA